MYKIDMDVHPPLDMVDIPYIGELDSAGFFSKLTDAGIDMACGTLKPPAGFFDQYGIDEAVRQLNQGAMQLANSESRYIPVLLAHPDCAESFICQMEQYAPFGVGMIEIDGEWINRPEMTEILDGAVKLDVAVSIREASPQQVIMLAERFPSLRILAGIKPTCVSEVIEQFPQVYVQLSGPIWSGNYILHEWSKRMNGERLLFGTGYPDSNPASKIAAFEWELRDQSNLIKQKVFSENALRFLKRKG